MDTMAFVAPGAPQQNLRASPPSMLKTVMPPKSLALSSHPGRPDGAVEASTFETPPQHGSWTLLVLAGGVGVAASRASRARTVSKAAAAVMEVAAGTSADEEELPPPPPPPFNPAKQLGVTAPLGYFDTWSSLLSELFRKSFETFSVSSIPVFSSCSGSPFLSPTSVESDATSPGATFSSSVEPRKPSS